MNRDQEVKIVTGDYLATLKNCGGIYKCPINDNNQRSGPLVGYAGNYRDRNDVARSYVGEVYYNFAMIEEHPHVLDYFALELFRLIPDNIVKNIDVCLGSPMGGILLASALGRILGNCRVGFTEKKITSLATKRKREESILILNRHRLSPGDRIIIVEDVCHNFSTTDKTVAIIREAGAQVLAIVSEFNRSTNVTYRTYEGQILPVISLIHVPTLQYRQDDPYVLSDIMRNNVVWKPKDDWEKLLKYSK